MEILPVLVAALHSFRLKLRAFEEERAEEARKAAVLSNAPGAGLR